MSEERKYAEAFLDSLLDNGLILDWNRADALWYLEFYGKVATMAYVEHYSMENEDGELRFVDGTRFSYLIDDMEFDRGLRDAITTSLSSIRVYFQNHAHACISEFLEENPDFVGVLSGIGTDYLEWSDVVKMSLDALLHDYNYYFPEEVKVKIASKYGLTPEAFSAYMRGFCIAYSFAESGRKLLDIRFDIDLPPLPADSKASLKWNYRRTMIGNIILLYDHLLDTLEGEDAAWLADDVSFSLSECGIRPERIGWVDDEDEDLMQIFIEDQVFLGRPTA